MRHTIRKQSFSPCHLVPKLNLTAYEGAPLLFLQAVDNVSLLQIDYVWCLYMLKDVARLAVAKQRLASARSGLRKAHGAHMERLRMLQGGFCPELAL